MITPARGFNRIFFPPLVTLAVLALLAPAMSACSGKKKEAKKTVAQASRPTRDMSVWGVAIKDEHAVIGEGAQLTLVNVSNVAKPKAVAFLGMKGIVHAVAVSGNTAYVASDASDVQIVDISKPTLPNALGAFQTKGPAYDMVVSESLLFVADTKIGLQIVNVADPAAPAAVGLFATPDIPNGVAVAGKTAYLALSHSGVD